MWYKIFLPVLICFTVLSALSQTVDLLISHHFKTELANNIKKGSEEEKSEEKNEEKEKESDEVFSFRMHSLIMALLSEQDAAEKHAHLIARNYQEPTHYILTPPPRLS